MIYYNKGKKITQYDTTQYATAFPIADRKNFKELNESNLPLDSRPSSYLGYPYSIKMETTGKLIISSLPEQTYANFNEMIQNQKDIAKDNENWNTETLQSNEVQVANIGVSAIIVAKINIDGEEKKFLMLGKKESNEKITLTPISGYVDLTPFNQSGIDPFINTMIKEMLEEVIVSNEKTGGVLPFDISINEDTKK